MFKKKLWAMATPPLRVFKLDKDIMLCTSAADKFRVWLYDGEHFRAADNTTNDYWDTIFKMYPDYFKEKRTNRSV